MSLNGRILLTISLAVSGCTVMPIATGITYGDREHQDIERARGAGAPIVVLSIYPSVPDSAGGVDPHVHFVNTSNMPLKYVAFTVLPYNAVGDVVASEIGNETYAHLRATGPYPPDSANFVVSGGLLNRGEVLADHYWEDVWWNTTIRCLSIDKIDITYMDNREAHFAQNDIAKLLSNAVKNSCGESMATSGP